MHSHVVGCHIRQLVIVCPFIYANSVLSSFPKKWVSFKTSPWWFSVDHRCWCLYQGYKAVVVHPHLEFVKTVTLDVLICTGMSGDFWKFYGLQVFRVRFTLQQNLLVLHQVMPVAMDTECNYVKYLWTMATKEKSSRILYVCFKCDWSPGVRQPWNGLITKLSAVFGSCVWNSAVCTTTSEPLLWKASHHRVYLHVGRHGSPNTRLCSRRESLWLWKKKNISKAKGVQVGTTSHWV